jgi:hypothetical protein
MCRNCGTTGDQQNAVGLTASTPENKEELQQWIDDMEFHLKDMRHRRAGMDLEIEG